MSVERQAAGRRLAELMADATVTDWHDHDGVEALLGEIGEVLAVFEAQDGELSDAAIWRRLKLAVEALQGLPEGCREARATLWAVITIELTRLSRMRRRGRQRCV